MSTVDNTIDIEQIILVGLVRWAHVPPAPARLPHEEAYDPKEPNNCHYEIEVECSDADYARILKAINKSASDQFAPQLRTYPKDVVNETTKEIQAKKTDKKFLKVKATKIRGETTFSDITVVDINMQPLTQRIANDSTAAVKLSIEPVKKGSKRKTVRLKAIKVLNLIPYESNYNDPLDGLADIGVSDELALQQQQQAAHSADQEENW